MLICISLTFLIQTVWRLIGQKYLFLLRAPTMKDAPALCVWERTFHRFSPFLRKEGKHQKQMYSSLSLTHTLILLSL